MWLLVPWLSGHKPKISPLLWPQKFYYASWKGEEEEGEDRQKEKGEEDEKEGEEGEEEKVSGKMPAKGKEEEKEQLEGQAGRTEMTGKERSS